MIKRLLFVLWPLGGLATVAYTQAHYSLKDIGFAPGATKAQGNWIGNDGSITGWDNTGVGSFASGRNNPTETIQPLPGGNAFQSNHINNNGVVAGESYGSGQAQSALYTHEKGTYQFFDFGRAANFAMDVNDLMHVIGAQYQVSDQEYDSYLWSPTSGLHWLSRFDSKFGTNAICINNSDVVAGYVGGASGPRSAIWSADNQLTLMGAPEGQVQSDPTDINDNGFICGSSYSPQFGNIGFMRRPDGSFAKISNPVWSIGSTIAQGINNSNQVAGWAIDRPNHNIGITWTETGGTVNLNDVVDSSGVGWDITYASGINDAGQIVGVGKDSAGLAHAILLTPVVPEPCTLLVLAPVALLVRARRKTAVAQSAPAESLIENSLFATSKQKQHPVPKG